MAAIEIKPARSNWREASLFIWRFYLCEKNPTLLRPIKSNEALYNNKSLECMLFWIMVFNRRLEIFARRRTVNRPVNGYQFSCSKNLLLFCGYFPTSGQLGDSVTHLCSRPFHSSWTNEPASQFAPLLYLHFSRIKITIAKYLAHDFFVNIFRSNATTVERR